jgi:hypothetical protein
MFKKEEIDSFMEMCRIESVDSIKEAKKILMGKRRPGMDIDGVVKNTVEGLKKKEYIISYGNPDQIKGLRKEAKDGSL